MITAILIAQDAPGAPLRREAVTRSLSSLVEACVQGLVADAIIIGPAERGLDKIADDAGCTLVETTSAPDGLRKALEQTRYDRVFLLQAGYAIERGFIDELHDALAYEAARDALVLRATPHSLLTRLAPRLSPAVGLVALKATLGDAGVDIGRLSARLKSSDLTTRARKVI